MSPKKWIESKNAIGIISKSGRYGGTFAHSDIAFEFASWVSPEFRDLQDSITELNVISEQMQTAIAKGEERVVQRVHWHFGEVGRLNLRVRCRDLEQLGTGSYR